jgi:hypothetical protein
MEGVLRLGEGGVSSWVLDKDLPIARGILQGGSQI